MKTMKQLIDLLKESNAKGVILGKSLVTIEEWEKIYNPLRF